MDSVPIIGLCIYIQSSQGAWSLILQDIILTERVPHLSFRTPREVREGKEDKREGKGTETEVGGVVVACL